MNLYINSVAIASSTTTPLDLAFPYEPTMVQSTTSDIKRRHDPRKNRSRNGSDSTAAVRSKAKSMKKPDPNAPKITYQCTECGRVFLSDKARFGHMRLHPEREWRGINPPLNFRRSVSVSPSDPNAYCSVSVSPSDPNADLEQSSILTEEELDIADYLILLANGPNLIDRVSDCRFEYSSCKRVFGSHQALEEHSASHKNVKGCLAIAKSDEETEECALFRDFGREKAINLDDKLSMILGTGDERSTCSRVFSTGQALDGHKTCHWERVEENVAATEEGRVNLDLNMPAPVEDDSSSSYSSGLILDLRLGL